MAVFDSEVERFGDAFCGTEIDLRRRRMKNHDPAMNAGDSFDLF